MFCKKCGKQIAEGTMCDDCARAEYYAQPQQPPQPNYSQPNYSQPNYAQPNYAQPGYQPQPQPTYNQFANQPVDAQNKMYGFGKALTGTILALVSIILYYAGVSSLAQFEVTTAIILMIMGLPCAIIGLVFGISSIKAYTRRKAPCVKPIVTLILGIAALVMAAIMLLIYVIILFGIMFGLELLGDAIGSSYYYYY